MRKLMAFTLVCAISGGSACLIKEKKANEAQAWMCTTYYLTKKGYSDEVVATVGIMGAIDGPLQGAAVGAAFGGVAGFAMGAIIGA